jgi:hypothetical protein
MKLRTRISITAVATAAALGTTGAILLPAASAHPLPHTVKFTSVQESATQFSPTTGVAQDKDVNPAGKVIGYDVIRFVLDPKARVATLVVAVDLQGGFLYGQLRETSSPVLHGTVTGGTGAYRGATGTITARTLDQDGDRTAVTITYHS